MNNPENKSPEQCAFEAGYLTRPRQSASELCNPKVYPLVADYIERLRLDLKKKGFRTNNQIKEIVSLSYHI